MKHDDHVIKNIIIKQQKMTFKLVQIVKSWKYLSTEAQNSFVQTAELTRSSAVAKRPCDCGVGQFWPNITGRRYSAPNLIRLSSTTVT